MADDGTRREREQYDPKAVDRAFGAVRFMHRHRLINPLYYAAAFAMIPAYYAVVAGLNELQVHGRERLPPWGTGFFLLSNHISMLDGQVLSMMTFPRTYWFPSKASFYRSTPQAMAYLALTGFKSFPVRRGERDLRSIRLIEDLLQRGESVLLFPEGTRSKDGTLGKGKIGVGRIVRDSKPIVVPAYVEGLDQILTRGRLLPHVRRRAGIQFGAPLALDDLYDQPRGRATGKAIVDRVMAAIADLRNELHARPEWNG